VHAALSGGLDEGAVQGASGLAGSVDMLRRVLSEPTFTVEVRPIVDGDLIWRRGATPTPARGLTAVRGRRPISDRLYIGVRFAEVTRLADLGAVG
jgi:hypothetical protein